MCWSRETQELNATEFLRNVFPNDVLMQEHSGRRFETHCLGVWKHANEIGLGETLGEFALAHSLYGVLRANSPSATAEEIQAIIRLKVGFEVARLCYGYCYVDEKNAFRFSSESIAVTNQIGIFESSRVGYWKEVSIIYLCNAFDQYPWLGLRFRRRCLLLLAKAETYLDASTIEYFVKFANSVEAEG